MADLSNEIDKIQHSIYGEEIRDSIASGLKKVNADVTSQNDAIEEFTNLYTNALTDPIEVDPSYIVSVDDAAPMKLDNLVVNVEPVQDLHGYDHPWPAGGGKNKLNIDESAMVTSGYDCFFPITLAAGTYSITCFGTFGNGYGSAIDLDSSIGTSGATVKQIISSYAFGRTQGATYSFTLTQEEADAVVSMHMRVNGSGITFADIEAGKLQIELGSSTTYAPYSNICPITGWNGATVTDVGANMFTGFNLGWSYENATGERSTNKSNAYCATDYIRISDTLHLKNFSDTLSSGSVSVLFYDDGKNYIAGSNYVIVGGSGQSTDFVKEQDYPISIPQDAAYAAFKVYRSSGNGNANAYAEASIMLSADVETVYEPYKSRTASIDFPSTVYGGAVNLATGELVITKKLYNASDIQGWRFASSSSSETRKVWRTSDTAFSEEISKAASWGMCTKYAPAFNQAVGSMPDFAFRTLNTGVLYVCDSRYPSSDYEIAFKESLSDVQFVFGLAEPITLPPLTPAELELFKGTNHISADAGQIAVTYRQDVIATILKKVNDLEAMVLEN